MKKKDITQMAFRDLYPLYVQKVERKGHSQSEVNQIIYWLTGYNDQSLSEQIETGATLANFFPKRSTHKRKYRFNQRNHLRHPR